MTEPDWHYEIYKLGLTGAGKTILFPKILAELAMQHGDNDIAVLADAFAELHESDEDSLAALRDLIRAGRDDRIILNETTRQWLDTELRRRTQTQVATPAAFEMTDEELREQLTRIRMIGEEDPR